MLTFLLDLFFPRLSLTGKEGALITDEERTAMRTFPVRLTTSVLQKRGMMSLDLLLAGGDYERTPLLKKAIRSFKYGGKQDLHADLSAFIIKALPTFVWISSDTIPTLCPVPLHWSRQFSRGFNQAELLACDIAKATGWPMKKLLKRTRATGHQAHRKRTERLTAMNNAFAWRDHPPAPSCVIVIDDVSTTGATLDECAKILKQGGVKRVIGLVVAYG